MSKIVSILTVLAGLALAAGAQATPIFVDWTAVDFTANTASGNLGGVAVSATFGNIDYAITDGTSPAYSYAHYTPALPFSDVLELQGHGITPYSNSVTFSAPVTNIILHISSLASTLTFTLPNATPIPVAFVSGSIGASGVVGNQVIGQLSNRGPADCPTDVCGTVMLMGTFTALNFTSYYHTWPGIFAPVDGVGIQIGATVDGVPAPDGLALLGLGLLAIGGLRLRHQSQAV